MPIRNILYKREVPINDNIKVIIPTVGEVLEDENEYLSTTSLLISTPCDMMVQLDDMGIDFSEINDYDLFLILFNTLAASDTSLIFGDLDLSKFVMMQNVENGTVVVRDNENDITIDRGIYQEISNLLRRILHQKRNNKKPGNTEAKKYMIERARKKMRRRKTRTEDSALEEAIVALVNTEQFPYTYESVLDMSIYQFYESLHQIINKIDYDNRMRGVYAGTVSTKHMSQDDFNWLSHK